jgi:hypothetical protein
VKRWRVIRYDYNLLNGPGIHFVFAEPDGRPCHRYETEWRKISGILIRTYNTQTFFYFRRYPDWLVK